MDDSIGNLVSDEDGGDDLDLNIEKLEIGSSVDDDGAFGDEMVVEKATNEPPGNDQKQDGSKVAAVDHGDDATKPVTGQEPPPACFSLTASFSQPQPVGRNYVLTSLPMQLLEEYQFGGNYSRYLDFASIVQSLIDADSNLLPTLKYAALLKLTFGEARRCIIGLTGPNQYDVAKKLLEQRYYRPVLIMEAMIEELNRRQSMLNKKNRLFYLIRYRSDIERLARNLKMLNAGKEFWRKFFTLTVRYLPSETKAQFREKYPNNENVTVEDFIQFLDQTIQPMETLKSLEGERRRGN